jgi:hypothetical protein
MAMAMATVTVTAMDRTVKEVKRSFLRQGRRAEESSEWVTNLPAKTSINFVSAIKLRRLNIK